MSVKYIIAHEHHQTLDTKYFIEHLRKKWSGVNIHVINEPNAPLLQFETSDDFWVLGDFMGTAVSYYATGLPNTAQFALWYRSIVPCEWQLKYYDTGLYFDVMYLKMGMTEDEIIAGFNTPFDIDKYK